MFPAGSTALRLRVRPTLAETGRQQRASRPEDKTRRNQLPRGTLHSPPVGLFQGMGRHVSGWKVTYICFCSGKDVSEGPMVAAKMDVVWLVWCGIDVPRC